MGLRRVSLAFQGIPRGFQGGFRGVSKCQRRFQFQGSQISLKGIHSRAQVQGVLKGYRVSQGCFRRFLAHLRWSKEFHMEYRMSPEIQGDLEGFTGISGAFSRVLEASRESHLCFREFRGVFRGSGGFTGIIRAFLRFQKEFKRSYEHFRTSQGRFGGSQKILGASEVLKSVSDKPR